MSKFTFNASEAPESEDFTPIPKAEYIGQIIESDIDVKSTGTEQIKLTYEILDGQHKGRKINMWYTVKCANQTATDIGMRQLRQICEAIGLAGFNATEQLHKRPMILRVDIDKNNADYNTITSVKPYAAAPAANSEPVADTTAPAAAKPWEN